MADFLNVNEILKHLDLKENMIAAEFGCGSAVFAIELAKQLDKGRVYALDIQEQKLSALKGKAKHQRINNIVPILCDLESPNGSTLKNDSLDVVLIPNVLFQSEEPSAIIKEASRLLKSQGQLLVIDWLKNNLLYKGKILNPANVKEMAEKMSFSFKKEFGSGDYHYSLLFIKK